jgi:hypothetical protein
MSNKISRTAALTMFLMAGAALPAFAAEDAATDYAPKGLPIGAFRAFPTIYAGIFYDDNVYRVQTGTVSDVIYNFGADVNVQSNWSRHALTLSGAINDFRYGDNSSENRTDWRVGAEGRADVARGIALNGNASYATLFEPRNSPNTPGFAAKPLEYSIGRIGGSFVYQPTRLGVEVGASLDNYSYEPTPLIGGGVISNLDREHQELTFYGRATYEFSPGARVFARGSYNERDFDVAVDRNGQNRNSDGYAIDAGVDLRLTRLIEGQVYIGYINQDYAAPLPDVSGINYGAALTWYPTQLLTVRLNAARQLVDTTLPGASASDNRSFGVIFDYEFLRNVLVRANFDYLMSVFPGSTREDSYMTAGIGFRYLMNNYLSAGAGYTYSNRDSNVVGQDFDDNTFRANLNVHF